MVPKFFADYAHDYQHTDILSENFHKSWVKLEVFLSESGDRSVTIAHLDSQMPLLYYHGINPKNGGTPMRKTIC